MKRTDTSKGFLHLTINKEFSINSVMNHILEAISNYEETSVLLQFAIDIPEDILPDSLAKEIKTRLRKALPDFNID